MKFIALIFVVNLFVGFLEERTTSTTTSTVATSSFVLNKTHDDTQSHISTAATEMVIIGYCRLGFKSIIISVYERYIWIVSKITCPIVYQKPEEIQKGQKSFPPFVVFCKNEGVF